MLQNKDFPHNDDAYSSDGDFETSFAPFDVTAGNHWTTTQESHDPVLRQRLEDKEFMGVAWGDNADLAHLPQHLAAIALNRAAIQDRYNLASEQPLDHSGGSRV
jgi:hypothetical protein